MSVFNDGYIKFKTPFYTVSISPPDKISFIQLPANIASLIDKIEITENYISNSCVIENFSITFVEGSREPFPTAEGVDTSSLYNTSNNPGQSLTNRSGMLTDLRFTSQNGNPGITAYKPKEEAAILSTNNLLNSNSPTTINVNNELTYLFQEGNLVQIEWGYLEDPHSVRVICNAILMVQSDFPQAGQSTITVNCLSPIAMLDQINTPVGKNFKVADTTGVVNEAGKIIVDYKDISTLTLLKSFCAAHQIQLLASDTILNDVLDKNASKVWHAGESFVEFITKLAKMSNCFFIVRIDPNSSYKYVLEFINRLDFDRQSTISKDEEYLLMYKGPNSILKSVSIKADFAGLPNTLHSGLDSSGDHQTGLSVDGSTQVTVYSSDNSIINSDPSSKSNVVNSIVSSGVETGDTNINAATNRTVISPFTDSPEVLQNSTLAAFGRCGNKQITLEFATLGWTKILAGELLPISNIGNRYSTKYLVYSVTHTLDTAGYNCRGTAYGTNIGGNPGIQPGKPTQLEAPPTAAKIVPNQQFQGQTTSTAPNPATTSKKNRFKNK